MTEPAQHPPQTRGYAAAALVVHHDLHGVIDPPGGEAASGEFDRRQRMPPGDAGHDRAGQIFIEMGVECAGDVLVPVVAPAALGIGQREAAVEDRPVGIVKVQRQFVCGDQGCVGHESIVQ